jgi:uncharacterized protein YjbI with pentapeptide repeats
VSASIAAMTLPPFASIRSEPLTIPGEHEGEVPRKHVHVELALSAHQLLEKVAERLGKAIVRAFGHQMYAAVEVPTDDKNAPFSPGDRGTQRCEIRCTVDKEREAVRALYPPAVAARLKQTLVREAHCLCSTPAQTKPFLRKMKLPPRSDAICCLMTGVDRAVRDSKVEKSKMRRKLLTISLVLTLSVAHAAGYATDTSDCAIGPRAFCAGADLESIDLRNADVAGSNFSNAVLSGANFAGANLRGADMAGANLGGANLAKADLAGANLAGSVLMRANLEGANLEGANLRRALMNGAILKGADLTDTDLRSVDLPLAVLRGAKMRRAKVRSTILLGADLREADLTDADFSYSALRRVDMTGAVLTRALFAGADMRGCVGCPTLRRAHKAKPAGESR